MGEPGESAPPRPASRTPAAPPDGQRIETALLGLARIFAVVPLYPATHGLSQSVGRQFLAEMHAVVPERSALALEVHREGLRVAGRAIACTQPQVRRIHHDLLSLGIARVEICAEATPTELHRFATAILEARRSTGAARGLRQLELCELPESTRVMQREFGRRSVEPAGEGQAREATERVLEGSAAEREDDGAAGLRSALDHLFGNVIETLGAQRTAPADGQPFARSLEAVLDLGVHALRHAIDEIGSVSADPAALRALFTAAEKALAISDDAASVEILVAVLARASNDLPGEEAAPGADATEYGLSIEALRREIAGYGGQTPEMSHVAPGDRREELSILVHLLLASPPEAVQGAIDERLSRLFAEPLSPVERSLLVEAVRDLAEHADLVSLDSALPALSRALRSSPDRGLLGSVWRELATRTEGRVFDALWPHLVNDLLLGIGDDAARRDLLASVGRTSDVGRAHELARLARLEAVRTQSFAADLFDPPPAALFPIFADLLAREGGRLAELVLRGLQRNPPRWRGAEALATFASVTPACRALLYALLREGALEDASPRLTQQAGRILANALSELPSRDVGAAWVPRAIETIGSLGNPGDRLLLREIRRGFRAWPWRRWPATCRHAASIALHAHSDSGTEHKESVDV